MKAFNLPPSDSRFSTMTDAQWLWCYHNVILDEKDDYDVWENRLIFLGMFSNPDLAKRIHEEKLAVAEYQHNKGKPKTLSTIKKQNINENNVFEIEMKAAQLGYDPSMKMTPTEFIAMKEAELNNDDKKNHEREILNTPIDELMKQGVALEVSDTIRGNPGMPEDEFLSCAMALEKRLSETVPNPDAPVGREGTNESRELTRQTEAAQQPTNAGQAQYDEAFLQALAEKGLTLDDLTDIEIDE